MQKVIIKAQEVVFTYIKEEGKKNSAELAVAPASDIAKSCPIFLGGSRKGTSYLLFREGNQTSFL